jgi:hypothetical protein
MAGIGNEKSQARKIEQSAHILCVCYDMLTHHILTVLKDELLCSQTKF